MDKARRFSGAGAFARLLGGSAGLAAALSSSPALADSRTISAAITDPVTTANAANGSAGDITIDSAGSVIVTGTGPAAAINSSNALSNAGTISTSASSGATALLIDGSSPITTTLTNSAAISVTGTGGAGNYGVRLTNGAVSGVISFSTLGSVTVAGTNSYGVSIESPFIGNVTLNSVSVTDSASTAIAITAPLTGSLKLTGTTSSTGEGGVGLLLGADVSGTVTNAGSLIAGTASATITATDGTTTTAPLGGQPALWIQGGIGGGFVNDRYYVDSTGASVAAASVTSADTLITGTIRSYAGGTAVLVKPGAAGHMISLSAVGAAGTDDAYGFVNRGTIVASGNLAGKTAAAVHITGVGDDGLLYGAAIENGLINQANGSIAADATDAAATAIDIDQAAIVPVIVNKGSVNAAVASSKTAVGTAVAVKIEGGASVTSVRNSGTIAASNADSGGIAYGVLDLAGTVASVTNSGTISTSGSGGSRAIDLSAGTGAQTVNNSGTIAGDIVFGNGDARYVATSGKLAGTLSFGTGNNLLQLNGASVFANPIVLATGGQLAVSAGGTSSLNISGTPPTLSSLSLTDQSQLIVDVTNAAQRLAVSGAASFTGQSSIKLVISQAPDAGPTTVLTAAGGLSSDHATSLLSGTSTPFLYSLASYSVGANALTVTLHQKTASEVGLGAGVAPLFDQSFAAYGHDGVSFQAIANLPDQASLLAAYRQIEPPSFGSMPVRLAQSFQSAGAGAISARFDALTTAPADVAGNGERFGLWFDQTFTHLRHADSQDDPGFKANGYGISVGGDYAPSKALVVGLGFNFAWNGMHIDGVAAVDTKPFAINSQMADIYAGWHSGPFFVQATGSLGRNSYDFQRQINIASIATTQSAQWSGYQYGGSLNAGARFRFGRVTVQPSNAFSYISLHQDKYSEIGGGDFALAVLAKDDKATLNTSRLAIAYCLPAFDGTISFGIRGAYVAQLDKTISPLQASFLSGGTSFAMATDPLKGSQVQEGIAVGFQQPQFYLGLSGDRRQESGFSDSSVSAVMRVTF